MGEKYPPLPLAGGKEIKIDHDALEDVVKQLEKDLRELKSARFSESLTDKTPTEAAMGDYQAGRSMYTTLTSARDSIGNTYDQFITAYEQVIEAIRASNKNHKKADDRSKQGVQNAANPHSAI